MGGGEYTTVGACAVSVQRRIPREWCCGQPGLCGVDIEPSACADVERDVDRAAVIPPVTPICEAREDSQGKPFKVMLRTNSFKIDPQNRS